MKKQTCLLISCLTFSAFLYGCDNDDVYERGSQCNATYLVNVKGKLCYFGDCGIYDTVLRDHFCPVDVPYCVETSDGRHYCGTHCPEGYDQTGYRCEKRKTECWDDEILCQNECIDPMTSTIYCGSDDNCIPNKCRPDQVCQSGQCQCPESSVVCDDQCVNIQNDTKNCGGCLVDCTFLNGWSDGICQLGKCIAASCLEGYHTATQDDGSIWCEPDIIEPCGDSGDICPPNSMCIPELGYCFCYDGYTNCENGCFHLDDDIMHCGSCDKSCHVANAENVCEYGACRFTCFEGYAVSADGAHCEPVQPQICKDGETRCNDQSYEICQDGAWMVLAVCTDKSQCHPEYGCDSPCHEGFTYCSPDLCTNIQEDDENCGGCGIRCNVANATNLCHKGKCTFTCDKGYVETADGTACELGNCSDGERRCNNDNLQTCVNHQWVTTVCTAPANGVATCIDSTCYYTCLPEYHDCNGKCVDLQKDVNNCGSCGTKCNVINGVVACNHGVCSSSCPANYLLCDHTCIGPSKKGIVYPSSYIYDAEIVSSYLGSVDEYTILDLYGQSGSDYVINIDERKRLITQKNVYILPATGLIDVFEGVNVRVGPGINYSIIDVVYYGGTVVIDGYKEGEPHMGAGWFHITSPHDAYMSAYYVTLKSGSSAAGLPDCP